MTVATRLMNALSFSHLAGIRPAAGKTKAEEEDKDKDKQREGESDADYAKRMEEEDEDKDQDRSNGDSKKGKNAEGDDLDEEGDKKDEKDPKSKKGKAKKADDSGESEDEEMEDDDDEAEMHGRSPVASARRRERARCGAIFADRAAARNPELAAQLAFNTSLSRKEALAVLQGTKAAPSGNSQQRADRNPRLGPGGEASQSSAQAVEASWGTAMQKVRPDLKK